MKKTTHILTFSFLLIPLFLLNAEDGLGVKAEVGARADMRADRVERVEARQEARQEAREDIKVMRNDRMEARKDSQAEFKVKVEARRAELKAKIKDERAKRLDANAKDRVEKKLYNIYKGLTERLDRLTYLDSQITRRLALYTAANVSITSVTTLQTPAQSLLAQAKVDVAATKAAATAELTASTTKETLRALVGTAETSIKASAESYRKVLEALKALPKLKVRATTTASSTL